jgi:hypothetical protein
MLTNHADPEGEMDEWPALLEGSWRQVTSVVSTSTIAS